MKAFKQIAPKNRRALRAWLRRHHLQAESVWVVLFKQSSGRAALSIVDVNEEALCFGWIDSLPGKVDALRFKLLISPRKPRSVWSAINKKRVARLTRLGLMHPSGLAKVREAKRSGTWRALESSDRLEIPKDLARAFTVAGRQMFMDLAPSLRRATLEWIQAARKPETRAARIRKTVSGDYPFKSALRKRTAAGKPRTNNLRSGRR